ncbi:MAG: hypothetical protein GC154_04270 [bacterium]|nr:hypothetical protein [bacterium]
MKIRVELTGQLKQAIGQAQLEYDLPEGSSIQRLFERLAAEFPEPASKYAIGEDGGLKPNILLFINDEQATADDSIVLHDGDVAGFLSPISGGSRHEEGKW